MSLTLREWRLAKEKSLEDMANVAGVARQTYAAWEQEPGGISISNAQKFANYLGLTLDDISFTPNSTKCSKEAV